MPTKKILINRAPGLTLWAAVVAQRLGFDRKAALTLGKKLAGMNAQAKGRSLGIYKPATGPHGEPPKKAGLGEEFWVEICGRGIPAKNTEDGIRAVDGDKPIDPAGVEEYLASKFGDDLPRVEKVMAELAKSFKPQDLAESAYSLYEAFRPEIPRGDWGVKGEFDLDRLRKRGAKG